MGPSDQLQLLSAHELALPPAKKPFASQRPSVAASEPGVASGPPEGDSELGSSVLPAVAVALRDALSRTRTRLLRYCGHWVAA